MRLALEYAAIPYVDVARLPEDEGGGEEALYEIAGSRPSGARFRLRRRISRPASSSSRRPPTSCCSSAGATGSRPKTKPAGCGRISCSSRSRTSSRRCTTRITRSASASTTKTRRPQPRSAQPLFARAACRSSSATSRRCWTAPAGNWVNGKQVSYADLSLFQVVEGLRYAFPRWMHKHEAEVSQAHRAARPCRSAAENRVLPASRRDASRSTKTASSGTTRSWIARN